MKLHWSPTSPFVRKVMIALHEKQMADEVKLVRSPVVFAAAPNPEVLRDNPLGKIPALVLDDGTCLFDSHVICEHLETVRPNPPLFPHGDRIQHLRREALCDGILDALLLLRVEAQRGDKADPVILSSLGTKVRASLASMERDIVPFSSSGFAVGQIGLVVILGYLDFRYAESEWRAAFPGLAKWYQGMLSRPSVVATAVTTSSTEGQLPLNFVGGPA